jgi:hypothetical protein
MFHENFKIIILSGHEFAGKQEVSLDHLCSPYHIIFTDYDVKHYKIKNSRDVTNAMYPLTKTTVKHVLIIYVGHGSESKEDHPAICPLLNSFDLTKCQAIKNNMNEIINMKFILDCCNASRDGLGKKKASIKNPSLNNIQNFIDSEWKILCLRSGLFNYKLDNCTALNSQIYRFLTTDRVIGLNSFLGLLNAGTRKMFISNNWLENKRLLLLVHSDVKYNYIKESEIIEDFVTEFVLEDKAQIPDDIFPGNADYFGVLRRFDKM